MTVTVNGATTLGTFAGTLSTAAQPNVTSVGTLTALTTSGTITMTAAASKIVPGATSFSHRNSADSADNLLLSDAGAATLRGKLISYNAIATAGNGVPAIVAQARVTAQGATGVTLASYANPATDGTFEVCANVLVTAAGATLAMTVTVAYTDEGSTARTLTLDFQILAGTRVVSITTAQGAIPYEGSILHLRVKASTTITIATAGTIGGATYNGEATIKQVA